MSEKKYRNGYLLSYAIQGMYGLLLGTYLPVYVSDILHINPAHIVVLTLIIYLPVILKPVLGIFSDTLKSLQKPTIIAGCLLFMGSAFLCFAIDASTNISAFGVLIFLSFLGLALMDVNFDTIMVNTLREGYKRSKNLSLIMVFNQIGALVGSFIASATAGVLSYIILFPVSACISIGLLVLSFTLPRTTIFEDLPKEIQNDVTSLPNTAPRKIYLRIYLFGILFLLFLNGDRMSDWILEPYVNGISPGLFDVYKQWLQLFIILGILGYLIAPFLIDKKDRLCIRSQRIIVFLLIIFAVYWILFPLVNFTGILILQGVIFFLGGISYILFLDVFMLVSQIGRSRFKGTIYQVFLALFQIGLWISVPLGVWLASIFPIKAVFMLCAVPSLISAFLMSIESRNLRKLRDFI